MKGLIFVYTLTALGVFGSLRKPIIGLYVYVLFAVLRPQYLWAFAGDMSNLSLMVGVAMLVGWALNGFGEKRVGRGGVIVALMLSFLCWTSVSAALAGNSDIAFKWVIELLKIVAPFLVGVTLLDAGKHVRGIVWVVVLAQAYISFEMNLSYYNGYNQVADVGFGGMDNNSFGISLVTTIGPALALALTEKKWIARLGAARRRADSPCDAADLLARRHGRAVGGGLHRLRPHAEASFLHARSHPRGAPDSSADGTAADGEILEHGRRCRQPRRLRGEPPRPVARLPRCGVAQPAVWHRGEELAAGGRQLRLARGQGSPQHVDADRR